MAAAPCLQPTEKALLARKNVPGFVANSGNNLVARLGEPRHSMKFAAILFLVSALAAPVVHLNPALLPVSHHVPLDRLIGPQDLARPVTGIAPELRNLIESGENARGDALAFRIAGTNQ